MGDIDVWSWRLAAFLPSAAAGFVVWFCFRRAASECYDAGYQAGVRSRDIAHNVSLGKPRGVCSRPGCPLCVEHI